MDFSIILVLLGYIHKPARNKNIKNAKEIQTPWTLETLSFVPQDHKSSQHGYPGPKTVVHELAESGLLTMPASVS